MIEQMKDVYKSGAWGDNALSNEFANTAAEMASGKYAMTVNSMGRIADIAAGKKYSEDDFGIFPAPYLDNQIIATRPPDRGSSSSPEQEDRRRQEVPGVPRPAGEPAVHDRQGTDLQRPVVHRAEDHVPQAMADAIEDFRTTTPSSTRTPCST